MRPLLLLLFILILKESFAQESFRLEVVCHDRGSSFFAKQFSYQTSFKDSMLRKREIDHLYTSLKSAGYLSVSMDSTVKKSNVLTAYIYVGDKFQTITIYNGNIPADVLDIINLKKLGDGKVIPVDGVRLFKAKIIQSCDNIGYPFAEVTLDSFVVTNGNVSAKLYLNRHELIRYDSLHIEGKTKAKSIFLRNYLGIKPGKVYNESTVRRIAQRLSELQFVEVIRPHTVNFRSEKARVNIFLKDRKASQFNILVGLLPGSSGQKVLITGDVKIHLFAPFGLGEELMLQWQKLQPKTQTLNVKVVYPYLLGLPLGVNVNFQLFKQDTSYLELDGDYGVQYQMIGSDYLKASYRQKVSIILDPDTNFVKINRALPSNLDFSTNEFALEVYLQKLNYRFNPVSGYIFQMSVAAGARTIKRNNAILGLYDMETGRSFGYLYDSIKLTTFQMHIAMTIDKFWKLNNRNTIRTMLKGEYLFSDNIIKDELYKIGGMSSLLGFDDRSIYTPYYLIGDLEYRFLLAKNSYFYTFFNSALVKDQGHYQYKVLDFPFGFGAGITFETKVGLFGFTYAVGKQGDNPITFNSSKIHFGYVNYF